MYHWSQFILMKLFGGHSFGNIHTHKIDFILANRGYSFQTRVTLSGGKSDNMPNLSPDSRSQMDEVLRPAVLIAIHAESGPCRLSSQNPKGQLLGQAASVLKQLPFFFGNSCVKVSPL